MASMSGHFKEIVRFIFVLAYTLVWPSTRKYPCRAIIYYHSVKKKHVRRFEKQMAYLASRCKVVKPSAIRTVPSKGHDVLVAITFDDAFVSILENAIPVLKKYGFSAGICVPAGNLGQPAHWQSLDNCRDGDETVMSRTDIEQLSHDGFEIFSHTISHRLLTQIDEDSLISELLESKDELERITGREVSGISYPYGAHDETVCAAAQRAGYKFGFTIEPETIDGSPDNMRIGRFKVSAADSLLKFSLKVTGAYRTVKYLRGLKKLLWPKPTFRA